MPGAPNRPPETTPEPPVTPPVSVPPQNKALRRLAPARVALLLDPWKGAPNADLMGPFDKAEGAFEAGDFPNALSALDLLSVRFAEPRWPTLPEPFGFLRVPIPAPMPPAWNPDNALPPAERELRRARRQADEQLALAAGSVAWAQSHQIEATDLQRLVEAARTVLGSDGLTPVFYERIDSVWEGIRARVPRPTSSRTRPPVATPDVEVGET